MSFWPPGPHIASGRNLKKGERFYKTKAQKTEKERFLKNQVKPEPLWRNDGSFWSSNTLLRFLAVRAVSIIGFIFNISTSDFERTEDLVILIIVRNRNSACMLNIGIRNPLKFQTSNTLWTWTARQANKIRPQRPNLSGPILAGKHFLNQLLSDLV